MITKLAWALTLMILSLGTACNAMSAPETGQTISVSVKTQTMYLVDEDAHVLKTYRISTSRFGIGSLANSNKTPTGRFRISEKIGDGAKRGEIFQSRVRSGRIGRDGDPTDFVETRIMWLDGLSPENANTHDRYIYIHGTNSESKLGSPVSFGCVRMSNHDVLDLYKRVDVGTLVEITP